MLRCYKHISIFHRPALPAFAICFLLLLLRAPAAAASENPEPAYHETSVFLVVQGVGGLEVPAVISGDSAYLSVTDVFDFLKIRHSSTAGGDTVSGFFIDEQATYVIDKVNGLIRYRDNKFSLPAADIIRTETGLYLKTSWFGRVFGLHCTFSFRSLSVNMNSRLELPAIREMRMAVMRGNVSRLKGQQKADTVIGRRYPWFRLGMADWSVVATQRPQSVNDTWLSLSLGGIVAGGETIVSLNYNNYAQQQQRQVSVHHDSAGGIKPFDQRQQYYRWRFVNNNNAALRQVIAGKIFTRSTASIFAPVVGVQFTNTPTSYRRSFGHYTISDHTEPGWTVELYVNNALVDYTTADAAGFFTFQVPLVYGNSVVRLRFFGPWGEERTREENISVPFNFLPKREFEYTASAGVVEDGRNSLFSRIQMNYGATRHVTVGGGVEYLSSVASGKTMPFLNTSVRITSGLLFSADYTYNVRARGLLSYRLPANLQIDLDYTRYKKGQQAIIYNFREERKAIISRPFFTRHLSMFTRFTLNQIVLPDTRYTTMEWLVSGAVRKVGTHLTTYAIFLEPEKPFVYSNLGLSFRLPGAITAMPHVQYEYNRNRVMSVRGELGKYLFRNGYLHVAYEKNFRSQVNTGSIGFRFDLDFSQVGASALRTNGLTTLIQSARGSIIHDGGSHHTTFSHRASVGTGGVVLLAFLDLNGNERRDAGEPKVNGLKVNVNGGRISYNRRDTTVSVTDLEPFAPAFIDLKRSTLDQIAWQIKKPVISVMIVSNQLRLVEVPVSVGAEVSGTVYLEENNQKKGAGRIAVCFYRADSTLAARVLTESDGFFNVTGLAPGKYTVRLDSAVLHRQRITVNPPSVSLTITSSREGDVVDGLEFILRRGEQ